MKARIFVLSALRSFAWPCPPRWSSCAFARLGVLTGLLALDCAEGPTRPAATAPPPIASVHLARCGACHVRVEPGERTRDALVVALARHRKRVHLTETQWGALVDYLAPRAAPMPLADGRAP